MTFDNDDARPLQNGLMSELKNGQIIKMNERNRLQMNKNFAILKYKINNYI